MIRKINVARALASAGVASLLLAALPSLARADDPAPSPPPETASSPDASSPEGSGPTKSSSRASTAHPKRFTYMEEDPSGKRIPFRNGDPVPDGYRVESSPRMGILAGGIVMGSALWTVSTIAAIALDKQDSVDGDPNFGAHYWPMFIPVVGPFIAIKTADSSGTGAAILGLDGVAQAAALAMIIGGVAAPKLQLVPQHAITIGPAPTAGGAALQVGGTF